MRKTIHQLMLGTCIAVAAARAADTPAPPATPAMGEVAQGSLYALDSRWTDQHGRQVAWSKTAGKARVLAMGYASCKALCPRVIADMQRLEHSLSEKERLGVTFTFVSLDPDHDQPPQLRQLADDHQLSAKSWQVLTGTPDGVIEMAAALGIQFARLPDGIDFAHSYLICIVAPDGRITARWTNPRDGPAAALAALRTASAGVTR